MPAAVRFFKSFSRHSGSIPSHALEAAPEALHVSAAAHGKKKRSRMGTT